MIVFNVAEHQSLEGREGIDNAIIGSAVRFRPALYNEKGAIARRKMWKSLMMEAADGGQKSIDKSAPEPL